MRIKPYLLWGFLLISWMRDVHGGKILPISLSVVGANGITYLERKCRAASVFGNYFTRICKLGSKTMLIRPLIASINHCSAFVELIATSRSRRPGRSTLRLQSCLIHAFSNSLYEQRFKSFRRIHFFVS